MATGRDWIEDLVEEAVAEPAGAGGLPVGSAVPAIELESLDGDRIGLADLRGADTLLLFWNPDCGFCRQMHDRLLAWEVTSNGVTPRLVVVSSGDPERTRADRFRSTVLLDADYAVSDAFGAGGTPMAVLLTADGHVGSRVAAGAEAVSRSPTGDNVQYMDAAVLCRNCSWFGVYRQDVTERIRGCPACGAPNLAVRDVGDEQWQELGRQLLEGPDEQPQPSARQ